MGLPPELLLFIELPQPISTPAGRSEPRRNNKRREEARTGMTPILRYERKTLFVALMHSRQ